ALFEYLQNRGEEWLFRVADVRAPLFATDLHGLDPHLGALAAMFDQHSMRSVRVSADEFFPQFFVERFLPLAVVLACQANKTVRVILAAYRIDPAWNALQASNPRGGVTTVSGQDVRRLIGRDDERLTHSEFADAVGQVLNVGVVRVNRAI